MPHPESAPFDADALSEFILAPSKQYSSRSLAVQERLLKLHVIDGLSAAKISRELGLTSTQVHRVLETMQPEIEKYREEAIAELKSKYKMAAHHRIDLFGEQLQKQRTALAERDYRDLSTDKLLNATINTVDQIRKDLLDGDQRSRASEDISAIMSQLKSGDEVTFRRNSAQLTKNISADVVVEGSFESAPPSDTAPPDAA